MRPTSARRSIAARDARTRSHGRARDDPTFATDTGYRPPPSVSATAITASPARPKADCVASQVREPLDGKNSTRERRTDKNVTFGNKRWRVTRRARGSSRTTSRSNNHVSSVSTTRGVHTHSSLRVSSQNSAEPGYLGNGMTSLMFSTPVTYCTSRSNPSPNPACGTDPYLRRSRYHQ